VFFTIGIITITKHLCFSEEKDIKKLVKDGRTDGRTEGRGEGKTNRRRKEGRKGGRKEGRKVNDGRTANGEGLSGEGGGLIRKGCAGREGGPQP
jgi:hypothetical protein